MKLARNGKPVNGVFAPVIRISAVAICTMTKPMCPIPRIAERGLGDLADDGR